MVNSSEICSYCLYCHKITVFGLSFDWMSWSGLQGSRGMLTPGDDPVQLLRALVHVSVGKSSFAGTDVISLQGVSSIGHSSSCEMGSWSMTTAHSVCSALLSNVLLVTDQASELLVLVCIPSWNARPGLRQIYLTILLVFFSISLLTHVWILGVWPGCYISFDPFFWDWVLEANWLIPLEFWNGLSTGVD